MRKKTQKYTTEEFIEVANKIHNNRYSYQNCIYVNNRTKVKITCHIHGTFEQNPNSHTIGKCGCMKCSGLEQLTTEKFIEKAVVIHKNKYDYSLVNYVSSAKKIDIICSIHGLFEQAANSHLAGRGCDKCGGTALSNTEDFIKKSILIHGNKYDYSRVDYIKNNIKVEIICPIHGTFYQNPNCHLLGRGCKICCESHGERIIRNYLNDKNISYIPQHKAPYGKFDFYLDKLNVAIEYNGEQHYIENSFSSDKSNGYKNLRKVLKRDSKKLYHSLNSGIKILYIPFWEIKNIKNILDQYFEHGILNINNPPKWVEQCMFESKVDFWNKWYKISLEHEIIFNQSDIENLFVLIEKPSPV